MSRRDPIEKRVKRKKGFYKHLNSYVGVVLGLFFLNIVTGGAWWFQYTAASWGIAIIIHYFSVFGLPKIGPLDEEWEDNEYDREYNRMRKSSDHLELQDDELDLDEVPKLHKDWKDSDIV